MNTFLDFIFNEVIFQGLEWVLGGAFKSASFFLPAQIKEHFYQSNARLLSFIFLVVIICAIIRLMLRILGGLLSPFEKIAPVEELIKFIKQKLFSINLYDEGYEDGLMQAQEDKKEKGQYNPLGLKEKYGKPTWPKISWKFFGSCFMIGFLWYLLH